LFKAKTGVAWRDLPERYGPWKTVYNRFWRWFAQRHLTALVGRVRVVAEAVDELGREVDGPGREVDGPGREVDELGREVSVDSSIVRAHQHAAGARKAATPASFPGAGRVLPRARRAGDHAIGRSRGGPTKIRLACDGHGRPLSMLLTGGNVNDTTLFEQVMTGVVWPPPGFGSPGYPPAPGAAH
jgi:transposase